jgi:ATP-dependent RNA helicase RhlE
MNPIQPGVPAAGGTSFQGLGIAPKILDIVEKLKFVQPTPIQHQAIPVAIEGKDVIGIAQTGTGKTLAFGIPMIQRLAQFKGMGLILLPTRELALQVDEALKRIGTPLGLKTAVLIGGESMGRQMMMLKRGPHIIIATPGRLIDILEQKVLKLDRVNSLVLDEADRMLDMGFAPQIKKILMHVPPRDRRQTMLFSATMPDEIANIANTHMKMPIRVEVAPSGTAAAQVEQEVYFVDKQSKLNLLEKILTDYKGSVLVFSRTKFGAKKITQVVNRMGHKAAEIHSNRSLNQRLEALNGFKNGKYRVLIATDIAARGIDVTGIELVVNYDLPSTAEDYVHRIGRTGRAGLVGRAISFATYDQKYDVRSIERLIKMALPVSTMPGLSKSAPHLEGATSRPSATGRGTNKPRAFSGLRMRPMSRKFTPRSSQFRDNPMGFGSHQTASPSAPQHRPIRTERSHAQSYDAPQSGEGPAHSRSEIRRTARRAPQTEGFMYDEDRKPFMPKPKGRPREPFYPTGHWRRKSSSQQQRSDRGSSRNPSRYR